MSLLIIIVSLFILSLWLLHVHTAQCNTLAPVQLLTQCYAAWTTVVILKSLPRDFPWFFWPWEGARETYTPFLLSKHCISYTIYEQHGALAKKSMWFFYQHPTLGPIPSTPTRLGNIPCCTPAPFLQNQAARRQKQPTALYYFTQERCLIKSAHFNSSI